MHWVFFFPSPLSFRLSARYHFHRSGFHGLAARLVAPMTRAASSISRLSAFGYDRRASEWTWAGDRMAGGPSDRLVSRQVMFPWCSRTSDFGKHDSVSLERKPSGSGCNIPDETGLSSERVREQPFSVVNSVFFLSPPVRAVQVPNLKRK